MWEGVTEGIGLKMKKKGRKEVGQCAWENDVVGKREERGERVNEGCCDFILYKLNEKETSGPIRSFLFSFI